MPRKAKFEAWLDEHGIKLYNAGCIDKEIAIKAGCKRMVVWDWRRKRNLPPVPAKPKTGAFNWLDEHGIKLYEAGMIDKEIAKRAKCSKTTVFYWRQKRGLVPVAPRGSEDWRCFYSWDKTYTDIVKCIEVGMTDAEGAAFLGIKVENYRSRRIRYRLKPGRYERQPKPGRYRHRQGKLKKLSKKD